MFVESFHQTLKEIYFERKQNRRVNHLWFTLRKVGQDKTYEQWIKAEKGKVTVLQRESNKRPKQAEAIPSNAVSRQNAEYWQVQSTSDKSKVHNVRKTGSSVCNCLLRCSFCAACVHLFQCTCLAYAVRGIVSTHIHAVNITEPTECLMQIEEKCEELGNLFYRDKDLQNEKELEDLKRSAMSTIAELTDVLQKAPTRDTIHTALHHSHSRKTES